MTEPPGTPSERREHPEGTPHIAPPYPYPYPPGPYPGYSPAPPYYGHPPAPAPPRNGLGIASLVLAVLGLLGSWVPVLGLGSVVFGIVAMVLGFIGRGRVKRGTANNGAVAVGGMVLGGLAIVVSLAFFALWATVWKDVGGGDYFECMRKAGPDRAQQQRCEDQFRQNVEDRLSVTLTPSPAP